MEFKDKKVLVFGLGISGIAAARLLLHKGAEVTVCDGNTSLNKEEIRGKLLEGMAGKDVTIILGEPGPFIKDNVELLIISPGVPADLPIVEEMRNNNIPVWGEIELSYAAGKGDVLAVTGTNGKTTTTALLGEIIKNDKESAFVVGNIGNPYASIAEYTTQNSVIVAEMSSFQLESVHTFHPKVSAILNLEPDHLDRHHTFENYVNAKKNIAKNQTKEDVCVLNYEDELTRRFGEEVSATPFYFSSRRRLERGIYIEDGKIFYNMGEEAVKVCELSDLKLLGIHNYENVMAAAGMALAYHVPLNIVYKTITEFRGVEHRIEFVAEKNGVAYYNDSKGTNPAAAIKGIQAMNRPTFLIGGGYDKESSYEEWINAFDGKVKKLVLIGATKEKIADTARRLGFTDTVFAGTLEEAVDICVKNAVSGEAVLLSPACASWGMFKNYEERGDKFKELVNRL